MRVFETEREELAWFVGLIEGEGSFHVTTYSSGTHPPQGRFCIQMTDMDVIERANAILLSWGIDLKISKPKLDNRSKAPKQLYRIQASRAAYIKIIIDKTYSYYSEKKQSDCDRVLKNLADRGLL